jgi:hypothetical protein
MCAVVFGRPLARKSGSRAGDTRCANWRATADRDILAGMGTLKNVKHETFARMIIQAAKDGRSQGWAYEASGYKARGHSAEVLGCNLLKKIKVQQRIAELTAPAVKKTRTTIDSLAKQFDGVFDAAIGASQLGAAGAAASAKAKLFGFMRDRLEIGGVGSFDACETMTELVQTLLADQSPSEALATCDELRSAIELHAAMHAAVVSAPAPKVDERELSLAALRPKHRNGRLS